MRDPYAVLGVSRTASATDIKSAFRKLAKTYHPDANPDDTKAKERFADISRAYEVVGDEDKRKRFDRGEIDAEGRERFHGYPGGNGFTGADGFEDMFGRRARSYPKGGGIDAEDILKTMFGRGAGGRAGRAFSSADIDDLFGDPVAGAHRARPQRGRDVEVPLAVSAAQAINAGKAKLTLKDGRTIAVQLPRGVEDGQTIRLKGQGEAGPAGHRGDLLAKVRIRSEPGLRIDGRNVHADVEVALATAVAGGKVTATTPEGRKIALKVAPWTSSGRTLRVPGHGLPDRTGKRGDLFAVLQIRLDDDDRERLQALYSTEKAKG